jgi:hypothetical protein
VPRARALLRDQLERFAARRPLRNVIAVGGAVQGSTFGPKSG